MGNNDKILAALTAVTRISNNAKLSFQEKLLHILHEIMESMGTRKGSIMLVKKEQQLEVAASTNADLIGLVQPLEAASPSAWVVKNKKPLYMTKSGSNSTDFTSREDRYEKDAFLLAPILREEKVIGVISATEKIGQDCFSRDEQEAMLNIAAHVIGALETHRLADSLKKVEKVRSELFHMLIHDLKGPISEVVANLDILSYVADPESMEYVDSAQSACDTLHRMISNLLDIVRLEEGSLKLLKEKLEPGDLIREAVSRLHALARIKQLKVVEKAEGDAPGIFFSGDRDLLLRVLQNLLTNAIHYSPTGGTIETGFSPGEEGITFYVKDNGPGIAVEHRQAIFNKYVQVMQKSGGREYSKGLGLAFCKLAVEAHGGTIYVDEAGESGSGSCFKFTLNPSTDEES